MDKGEARKGEREKVRMDEGLVFPFLPVYKHWTTGLVLLIMEVGPYH